MKTSTVQFYLISLILLALARPALSQGFGVSFHGRPLHPKVFSMIVCLISDTDWPVVTGINLDAVHKNRNQFDLDAVRIVDGWATYFDADLHLTSRYRLLRKDGARFTVAYTENGGGSLTTVRHITFRILKKEIRSNGKLMTFSNLTVDEVEIP